MAHGGKSDVEGERMKIVSNWGVELYLDRKKTGRHTGSKRKKRKSVTHTRECETTSERWREEKETGLS